MGGLFGDTPSPTPVAAPTPPAIDPAAQAQADQAARDKAIALRSGGRASTILTGGMGDTTTPTTASKTLLGG